MPKINCIILDDEPLAVELLKKHASENENLNVLFATTEVFEAIDFLKKEKVDLIFTDIQMPELTGIQFMKILNDSHKFIVTTAYSDYALQSFNFRVIDYILKPITKERFDLAVKKYIDLFNSQTINQSTYIFVKADGRQVKINFSDLLYIEGLKDYVKIYLKDNPKPILTLMSLKKLEEELPSENFMRIHRSFIIGLDKIETIERNHIVIGKEQIAIAPNYKDSLMEYIGGKSL